MPLWPFLATVGGLLALDRIAVATLRPLARGPIRSAGDIDLSHDPVEFESAGLTLRGEILHPMGQATGDAEVVAILAHGWTGTAGFMLSLAEPIARAGYPAFVFDVRSHGRSDRASYVTIRHFRDDLERAIEFAQARYPRARHVVVGHSLGGAAAILATADGAEVDGLALIAAPADVMEVTADFFSDHYLPGRLMTRVLAPSWRLRTREPFERLDPGARVREARVPILVVQGGEDQRVPAHHAEALAEASGAELRLIPEASHRDILEHPELHAAVNRFLGERAAVGSA